MIQKFKKAAKSLTVEPCFFIFTTALLINYPTFSAMVYQKSQEYILCTEYSHSPLIQLYPHFNNNICLNIQPKVFLKNGIIDLQNRSYADVKIQTLASRYMFFSTLSHSLPIIFLSLLAGTWSDRICRKTPIYLSVIGGILGALINFYVAANMYITIHYVYLGSLVSGLFGGLSVHMLSCFSYLATLHDKNIRTVRFAFFEMSGLLGILFGSTLSSILLSFMTFSNIFIIIACIYTSALLYLIFIFTINTKPIITNSLLDQTSDPNSFIIGLIKYPFNRLFSLIKTHENTARLITQSTKEGRTIVYLKIICVCLLINLVTFTTIGEFDTLYLYVVHRFKWNSSRFANFLLVWKLGGILVLAVLLPFCKRRLKIHDLWLSFAGIISKALGFIVFAFAPVGVVAFLGALISMGDALPSSTLRSSMIQNAPQASIGKLFALLSSTEAITSILASLFLTRVYAISIQPREHAIINWFGNGFVYYLAALLLIFVGLPLLRFVQKLDKEVSDIISQNVSENSDDN